MDACGFRLEGAESYQKTELYKKSFTESSQVDPAQAQHIPSLLWHARPVLWGKSSLLRTANSFAGPSPSRITAKTSALRIRSRSSG